MRVVQCIRIALLIYMHCNLIAYDKNSCVLHWDCITHVTQGCAMQIAYDKHLCVMYWDCVAYAKYS